jgi:hypothetical protein
MIRAPPIAVTIAHASIADCMEIGAGVRIGRAVDPYDNGKKKAGPDRPGIKIFHGARNDSFVHTTHKSSTQFICVSFFLRDTEIDPKIFRDNFRKHGNL